MRLAAVVAAAAALAAVVGLRVLSRGSASVGGCSRTKRAAAPLVAEDVDPLVVLAAGMRHRLAPCGCSRPQLGGLRRLAALVDRLRGRDPDLVVVRGPGEAAEESNLLASAKSKAVGRVMALLHARDARRGGTTIGVRDTRVFVTEVRAGGSGGNPVHSSLLLQVNVTRASRTSEIRVRISAGAPTDAGGAVLGNRGTPELDLPDRLRAALVLGTRSNDIGAKELVALRVPLVESLESGSSRLRAKVESELRRYADELRIQDAVARLPRFDLDAADYVGSAACGTCHAAEHAAWLATRHARAFADLQADGRDADPECVVCHTVGWRRQDTGSFIAVGNGYGAKSIDRELEGVGCEACHGPGSEHVAAPRNDVASAGPSTCRRCHDSENSPHFTERHRNVGLEDLVHPVAASGR